VDYIIKKASSFTSEEQIARGIAGIPQDWPVEKYDYVDTIPDLFELINDVDLATLKENNQAAYDAWLQALRPIAPPPAIQSINVNSFPAFGAKTIVANGITKKLYARNIGIQQAVTSGTNTISYTINQPWTKIVGVEVVNSEALDTVDLKIFDTSTGYYSGVPDYMLNQFAFSHNIPKDYYIRIAQFDADIYQGMIIEITYNSISAKTVGINFIMNEVKS
jgi:hypothetical protein